MPAPAAPAADSGFEIGALEHGLDDDDTPRWIGWRRHLLVLVVALACLALLAFARWLSTTPYINAQWRGGPADELRLVHTPLPALQPLRARALLGVGAPEQPALAVDDLLLHRSPRWQVADDKRSRQVAMHEQLAALLAAGPVLLYFDDGVPVQLTAAARGWAGLGLLFWPLAGLALLLLGVGAAVALSRPQPRAALYLVMALAQAGSLLLIAVQALPGLGLPPGTLALDLPLRVALDAATGAAAVQAFALRTAPARAASLGRLAALAWLPVLLWAAAAWHGALQALPLRWWWGQGLCLALGLAVWLLLSRAVRQGADPYTRVMRRLAGLALATLALVTAAVAVAEHLGANEPLVAVGASAAWTLFLASLLLLAPFLARSRPLLREFALLAGISTVATSLDLLFVAVFSLRPFTSMAIAVFIALALYAGARQFLLNRVLGSRLPSTERAFETLYRAARAVQDQPARYPHILAELLRKLFDPLRVQRLAQVPSRPRVVAGGAALVVPVQPLDDQDGTPAVALALRFAQRGQRLFTPDDARLAERVVDQLRRVVTHDAAVERGRHEERLRIAQDLHDDIGARLLTLMYQAPTPEMEDYIRHTLKDLKTLTRGLAAAEHRLLHAAAEWKADLARRLGAANAELGWSFSSDGDALLSMVQWSALTRVLRELVSNALYHGHATRVDVRLALERGRLELQVADDGLGREPQAWSHGLGLGGVRKRVKQLGGSVDWRENQPRGIVCEVRVQDFLPAG